MKCYVTSDYYKQGVIVIVTPARVCYIAQAIMQITVD